MKILLIYYTGTYNTRFLTDIIEKEFVKKGDTVDRVEINCNTEIIETDKYDMIGLGYPIYGFNSPLPFNKYVFGLKFRKGQKYFIYKNSGETFAMNNSSSRIIIRRLNHKKMCFAGEYHYIMPYNIHFRFENEFIREILDKDFKLIKIMMNDLEKGKVRRIKSNFIYDLGAGIVGIQKIGGDVNSFFYKVDNDKCIKCMRCIKDCPENNIKLIGDKIKFGHKCDMCMRCSFYCPTVAISIGFLEKWKVTGDYKLKNMAEDKSPYKPYITEDSEGFYKCFIKSFKEIDSEYDKLFKEV